MTAFLNWLILFAFSAVGIVFARWLLQQSFNRWTGPTNALSFAFLYLMGLAAVGGLSFVAASVLYYEILFQGAFLDLVGLPGVAKFLLLFSGVWYAMRYAFILKDSLQGWAGE